MFRQSCLLAAIPLAFAAACGDKDTGVILGGSTASVRFINATDIPITVANGGLVGSGNNNLAFGASSSCLTVDPTNAAALTFAGGGGATVPVFAPTLAPGGSVTVVAFTAQNRTTDFASLNNTFSPASGSAGLRVFNASAGTPSLTVLANGTPLGNGAAVSIGTASDFFNVPAGVVDITFANGTTTVLDAGSMTFTAGQSSTVVVGPPRTGSTTLRSFTSTGC